MLLLVIAFIIYVKFVLFIRVIITGVLATWSNLEILLHPGVNLQVYIYMTERYCSPKQYNNMLSLCCSPFNDIYDISSRVMTYVR